MSAEHIPTNHVASTRLNFLIVEDGTKTIDHVRGVFAGKYDVIPAEGVSEAKAAFSVRMINAILIDYHLSDGTGLDIIEHVRNTLGRKTVPVVVLGSEENHDAIRSAGYSDVILLHTPVDVQELRIALKETVNLALGASSK